MKRAYAYLLAIGLGLLVLSLWMNGCLSWPDKLDSPAALQQRVLGDGPIAARVDAARGLVQNAETARKQIRQALAESRDAPPEIRCTLFQAAKKARDWECLPEIFRAMEDPDPTVRGEAGGAAREILGADYLFRANDPPEKRAQAMKLMRDDFERSLPVYRKRHPDPE